MTCHADAETQHMLELSVLAKAESRYRKMQADILESTVVHVPSPIYRFCADTKEED